MGDKNMNSHIFIDEEDSTLDLDIKTEIYFSGKDHPYGKMLPVYAEGKEEYVLIPLDIKDGDTIKVKGRGKHNQRSGKTGDLYVVVHMRDKSRPLNKTLICVAALVFLIAAFLIGAFIAHLSLTR